MLGDAVLYAASRATSSAIENVTRKVTWTVLAVTFLLCALVVGLMLAYGFLEPRLGQLDALGTIAGACLAIGLLCLIMPTMIERVESLRRERKSAIAATVDIVDEEAKEAVDHFGALQVVGTAFLFGLGAARRLKSS